MRISLIVKTKRMEQKFIIGDIVEYDNKIMVVKEPRDGCHFDLSCPKEWLVYCFVGVEDIKPVVLTTNILRKNRWFPLDERFVTFIKGDIKITTQAGISMLRFREAEPINLEYVHELQHFLFGLGIKNEMEV